MLTPCAPLADRTRISTTGRKQWPLRSTCSPIRNQFFFWRRQASSFLCSTGCKISPVLGFLAAGALLGPYGLGRLVPAYPWVNWVTFTNPEGTSHLAEFGVVFLLFTIGIELSWQRLRTLRRLVFGFGSLQVLLCTCLWGWRLRLKTVGTITAAAIVGLALPCRRPPSSIPVLAEQKRLNTPAGRASFSALLFQDLAVAPILFAIAVLDTSQPEVHAVVPLRVCSCRPPSRWF